MASKESIEDEDETTEKGDRTMLNFFEFLMEDEKGSTKTAIPFKSKVKRAILLHLIVMVVIHKRERLCLSSLLTRK